MAPSPHDSGSYSFQWEEPHALDLWQYFGKVGAEDKNTMINVESMLLTLSTALFGFLATGMAPNTLLPSRPGVGICLAIVGLGIAWLAGYVALLYGGYSNWNWAMADAIASARHQDPKWNALLPSEADEVRKAMAESQAKAESQAADQRKPTWWCDRALKLARPCVPTKTLAPIFLVFVRIAALSAAGYLFFLVQAIRALSRGT